MQRSDEVGLFDDENAGREGVPRSRSARLIRGLMTIVAAVIFVAFLGFVVIRCGSFISEMVQAFPDQPAVTVGTTGLAQITGMPTSAVVESVRGAGPLPTSGSSMPILDQKFGVGGIAVSKGLFCPSSKTYCHSGKAGPAPCKNDDPNFRCIDDGGKAKWMAVTANGAENSPIMTAAQKAASESSVACSCQ